MPGKRIDYLDDHTVTGIWEASRAGELAGGDAVEDRKIRSASVLAEKGYWNWMELDVHGGDRGWLSLAGPTREPLGSGPRKWRYKGEDRLALRTVSQACP